MNTGLMLLFNKNVAPTFKLITANELVTLVSSLTLLILLILHLLHLTPVAGFDMPGDLLTGDSVGCSGEGGQRYTLDIDE